MPKLKTNRGAAKRFWKTASGKYKHAKQNRRHIMEWKTAKKNRELRAAAYVDPADEKRIKQLLPYL